MARPSSIDLLPAAAREALQAWLRDPAITQEETTERTNALLAEIGVEHRVSKSAVNRYSMKMEDVGKRLRQSRQMAEMWIGRLGAEPQGKVGHLLNEMIRTLAFETTLKYSEGEEPLDPKSLKELAIAVHRLEQAAGDAVKREAEIRKQALEEAANQVEKIGAKGGMSQQTIQEIRRELLGVRA